jgi:hypothetical protein
LHGLLTNKNRRIPTNKIICDPTLPLALSYIWGVKGRFLDTWILNICVLLAGFHNGTNLMKALRRERLALERIEGENNNKNPLAPMGVLAPGSEHARPSARAPIDTSGNSPADMSTESPSNISPNLSKVISKVLEPEDNFWNYPPLSAQLSHSRGGPRIFFLIGILIFLLVRSPCKISKPYNNPYWGSE